MNNNNNLPSPESIALMILAILAGMIISSPFLAYLIYTMVKQ